MTPRVHFLSYSLGTGHRRAADLLAGAVRARGCESSHSALEEWVPWDYDLLFRHGYLFLATKVPKVWDWMYASPLFTRREALGSNGQRRRAVAKFRARGFDAAGLVVATQYNAMEIAADHRRSSGGGARLAVVLTDYDLYPLWTRPEVDLFLVPHGDLASRLEERGVARGRIAVTGLPVDPAFAQARDGNAARAALGLDGGARVVLLLGGGLGSGPLEAAARACLSVPGWTVILVCGGNAALRERLAPLARQESHRLRVLGYRKDLPDLMAAADLVVTKGGGLSLSEALYAGRPVVALPGLPGQEHANIAFMAERGWVTPCPGPEKLPTILASPPEPLSRCPLPPDPCGRGAEALLNLLSA